jgi:uncharacterized protein
MKSRVMRILVAALLSVVLVTGALAGCGGTEPTTPTTPTTPTAPTATTEPTTPTTTTAPTTPPPTVAPYEWPKALHALGIGNSGNAKLVSWLTVLDADTSMIVRVQEEASYVNAMKILKQGDVGLSDIDRVNIANAVEAIEEHATVEGGPWLPGLIWVSSYASSGFMVRGDSGIAVPADIKPGTRLAVPKQTFASMKPLRSLLAWADVDESDIQWIDTGSRDGSAQAIADGRADIAFLPPISPAVIEAAAAPKGVDFIDLNPGNDPAGHLRFLEISPLYVFGPSTVGPENTVGTWMPSSYKTVVSQYDNDAELIYNIAKWLDENYDSYKTKYESNVDMTLEDTLVALETTFVPAHPGLVKYLDELGLWTAAHEARNQFNVAWITEYIAAYDEAQQKATAQGVEIKPNNEVWIELWENLKKDKNLALISMHPSLDQNASVRLPAGYVAPEPEPEAPAGAADVLVEIVEIKNAHPGSDIEVTVQSVAGAEVSIQMVYASGTVSAFPTDSPKLAGADGTVYWKWNINSHVPVGTVTLTITAKLDGKEGVLVHKLKIT